MTTFTINSDTVASLKKKLNSITAVPLHTFPTKKEGIRAGYEAEDGNGILREVRFDLPAGTKFFTHKKLSRKALVRLLGKKAWVRGLNK